MLAGCYVQAGVAGEELVVQGFHVETDDLRRWMLGAENSLAVGRVASLQRDSPAQPPASR